MMNRFSALYLISTIFNMYDLLSGISPKNFLTIDAIAEGEAFHFPVIRAYDTLIAEKLNHYELKVHRYALSTLKP